jgi:hypothetical protein
MANEKVEPDTLVSSRQSSAATGSEPPTPSYKKEGFVSQVEKTVTLEDQQVES